MPPKVRITGEDILAAAVGIAEEEGIAALTARSIARRLGCSTQPIFSNYPNMEALKKAVLEKAYSLYVERTFDAMKDTKYPPYKASGMAYIEFAVEKPRLFRLLYMRDRTGEEKLDDTPESEKIIRIMMESSGLSYEQAHRLHESLWVFVHGLASMYATGFEEYDEAKAGEMLSRAYQSMLGYMKLERNDSDERNQHSIADKRV